MGSAHRLLSLQSNLPQGWGAGIGNPKGREHLEMQQLSTRHKEQASEGLPRATDGNGHYWHTARRGYGKRPGFEWPHLPCACARPLGEYHDRNPTAKPTEAFALHALRIGPAGAIDADVICQPENPPHKGRAEKLALGHPFKTNGEGEENGNIEEALVVGHHDARGFRQVGKPINPELPIRIERYVKATPPPEVEVHHTALPIKCRGKKPQHPHNGERHREEGNGV